MKRRRLEPDQRLDWRDPNMPVLALVEYRHPHLPPKRVMEAVTPERMSQFARNSFAIIHPLFPNWRNDPTYDLAKRRRRR